MMANLRRFLLPVTVLAALGCETAEETPLVACRQRWLTLVATGQQGETAVADGALTLRTSGVPAGLPGPVVQVFQAGVLAGDFDVKVELEGFASGGPGSFVQVGVTMPQGPAGVYGKAALGTLPKPGLTTYLQPPKPAPLQAILKETPATAATIRLTRTGSTVTVTATTADQTATTTGDFGTENAQLGIGLGNNDPQAKVTAELAVRVLDVQVTGGKGTTLEADDFACNSLKK